MKMDSLNKKGTPQPNSLHQVESVKIAPTLDKNNAHENEDNESATKIGDSSHPMGVDGLSSNSHLVESVI